MAHLHYSEQIAEKTFRGSSTKDAYMRAVKWYASTVIAKDKLHNVQVEFVKGKAEPIVTLKLFAVMDEQEAREQHCACCREMHHLFFVNEATECSRCSAAGYQRRLEERLQIKVSYYRELLNKTSKEEDV